MHTEIQTMFNGRPRNCLLACEKLHCIEVLRDGTKMHHHQKDQFHQDVRGPDGMQLVQGVGQLQESEVEPLGVTNFKKRSQGCSPRYVTPGLPNNGAEWNIYDTTTQIVIFQHPTWCFARIHPSDSTLIDAQIGATASSRSALVTLFFETCRFMTVFFECSFPALVTFVWWSTMATHRRATGTYNIWSLKMLLGLSELAITNDRFFARIHVLMNTFKENTH